MSIVAEWVHELGGYAQKQQLVAFGATDRALTVAVRSGLVRRARQGWYSTAPPSDPAFRALRVGGRLTGLSAVRAAGGWVLHSHGPLHVSVHENAARLRSQSSRRVRLRPSAKNRGDRATIVHWDALDVAARGSNVAVDIRDALYRVVLDEDLETAVAALDWALHTDAIDEFDLETLVLALPARLRHIRDWVDGRCESLPESLSRTRFRMLGHAVDTQVPLPNGQRLDLVVDGLVAIETDGEQFHRDTFLADRMKDIRIILSGRLPLRIPAAVVFRDWQLVVAAVQRLLRYRVHPSGAAEGRDPANPALSIRPAVGNSGEFLTNPP